MHTFTQETHKEKRSTWEMDGKGERVGGENWHDEAHQLDNETC